MTHLDFAMTTLLNGIWQGGILAAAMWIVLKLLPRLNSTTRFTVLWLTLLAVVALPMRSVMPGISIPRPRAESAAMAPANTFAPTTFRQSETRAAEVKAVSDKT